MFKSIAVLMMLMVAIGVTFFYQESENNQRKRQVISDLIQASSIQGADFEVIRKSNLKELDHLLDVGKIHQCFSVLLFFTEISEDFAPSRPLSSQDLHALIQKVPKKDAYSILANLTKKDIALKDISKNRIIGNGQVTLISSPADHDPAKVIISFEFEVEQKGKSWQVRRMEIKKSGIRCVYSDGKWQIEVKRKEKWKSKFLSTSNSDEKSK